MQWIPAAWLNAVDSMQPGKMHPYCMHWIPCTVIEFSVFQAAWSNGTLLNEVYFRQHDWMQWIPAAWMNAVDFCSMAQSIPIECSGLHAASLNAEDSMHCGTMDPDCIQWSRRSEAQCIPIECSGFYSAWPKASRLKAVDSMYCDWVQCNPFSVVKCIPIECSGFHAPWLNAVDYLQHGPKHPDWMQWIPSA